MDAQQLAGCLWAFGRAGRWKLAGVQRTAQGKWMATATAGEANAPRLPEAATGQGETPLGAVENLATACLREAPKVINFPSHKQ